MDLGVEGSSPLSHPFSNERRFKAWAYRPASYKSDFRGTERVIFIGPASQGNVRASWALSLLRRRRNGSDIFRRSKRHGSNSIAMASSKSCPAKDRRHPHRPSAKFRASGRMPVGPRSERCANCWRQDSDGTSARRTPPMTPKNRQRLGRFGLCAQRTLTHQGGPSFPHVKNVARKTRF